MTNKIVHNQLQIKLVKQIVKGMEDREWGQGDLSRHSGVPQPTISHLVTGKRAGSLATWNRLLQALEVA